MKWVIMKMDKDIAKYDDITETSSFKSTESSSLAKCGVETI